MNLRSKTILILISTFLVVIPPVSFLVQKHLEQRYAELEVNYLNLKIAQILKTFEQLGENLLLQSRDWAVWGDSYQFMTGVVNEGVASNFSCSNFVSSLFDIVLYLDNDRRIVYMVGYDKQTCEPLVLPDFIKNQFDIPIAADEYGIVRLSNGYACLAASSIINTTGQGPSPGLMVAIHFITPDFLTSIGDEYGSQIKIRDWDGLDSITHDPQNQSKWVAGPKLTPVNDMYMLATTFLPAPANSHPLVLETYLDRKLFREGKRTALWILAGATGTTIFFCILTYCLLSRFVIVRASQLNEQLIQISDVGDLTRRVSLSGQDELTDLANSINRMLVNLAESAEEVKYARDLYKQMFEKNRSIKLLIDPVDGQIVDASPSACTFYGYSHEELRSLRITDINTLSPDEVFKEMEKSRREERTYFCFTHRLKSGELRDVEVYSGPIEIDRKVFLYSIIHDVTERNRMEKTLRNSEERFRSLVENIPGIVYQYLPDENLTCLFISDDITDFTGLDADLFRNQTVSITSFIHPEDLPQVRFAVSQAVTDKTDYHSIYRFKMKDGQWGWVEEYGQPSFDEKGDFQYLIGVINDITERKNAEELLREQEEAYRFLFEGATEGIAVTGVGGQAIMVNQRFAESLGYTKDEILKMNMMDLVHPDDQATVLENNRKRLLGEPAPTTYGFRVIHRSGRVLDVEGSFELLKRGNQILGVQGIYHDVTERKRSDQRMFQEQKEQSIITLAGGIAHDFNNILMGIIGNAGLLQDEIPLSPEGARYLRNIQVSAERMAGLTNQLLAYARGGAHKPQHLDVTQMIHDTLDIIHGSLKANVKVELELAEDLWPIYADQAQFSQVLLNLVINACEAMENGGRLVISTNNVHFDQEWISRTGDHSPPGDYVHIRIADTGVGMSEDTLLHLFEPFFTTKFMGRGLGLAATMGILRSHKAAIEVETTLGKGSTFHLYIPRSFSSVSSQQVDSLKRPGKEGLVLIVDDEEIVRDVVGRILKRHGFKTIEAEDAATALHVFMENQKNIGLILLDIQIPGQSGIEILRAIRNQNKIVPVIIMSGYEQSSIENAEELDKAHNWYIKKPFSTDALMGLVNEALGE